MATTTKKKSTPVKVELDQSPTILVKTNGRSAAHELAALNLLQEEGYDLTKYAICDYDNYGSSSGSPCFYVERID